MSLDNITVDYFDKPLIKSSKGSFKINNISVTNFDRNMNLDSNTNFLSNSIVFEISQANMVLNNSIFIGIETNYSSPVIYFSNIDSSDT